MRLLRPQLPFWTFDEDTMLNVELIVGSTRPNRFADMVAPWVVEVLRFGGSAGAAGEEP